MIDAGTYVTAVARRVEQLGGQVRWARVGPVDAMVGDFYERSLLARGHIHFTVVVAPSEHVAGYAVRDFMNQVHQVGLRTTHQVPGGRTEIINFAGLVSHAVHPDAAAVAVAKPPLQLVGSTRPVVVDLATGHVHTFTGTRFLGMALAETIRTKQRQLFPPPAALVEQQPPPA